MVKFQREDHRVIKGVSINRPIVIGSVAKLRDKRGRRKTHNWSIYVRGLCGEDLSYFIKKVVFYLHEDFQNPQREVTQAPFEVVESGWGEFDIKVVITFHALPATEIYTHTHKLKLFHTDNATENQKILAGTKKDMRPVVSEQLFDLVFNDPSVELYKRLFCGADKKLPPGGKYSQYWDIRSLANKEQKTIHKLLKAHAECLKNIKSHTKSFHQMNMILANFEKERRSEFF